MPAKSVHLRQGQWDYLDYLADEHGHDNPSQALKQVVEEHRAGDDG